jgi:hypothetical protein
MCFAAGSKQTLHFSVGDINGFGCFSPELFFRGFRSSFAAGSSLARFEPREL